MNSEQIQYTKDRIKVLLSEQQSCIKWLDDIENHYIRLFGKDARLMLMINDLYGKHIQACFDIERVVRKLMLQIKIIKETEVMRNGMDGGYEDESRGY